MDARVPRADPRCQDVLDLLRQAVFNACFRGLDATLAAAVRPFRQDRLATGRQNGDARNIQVSNGRGDQIANRHGLLTGYRTAGFGAQDDRGTRRRRIAGERLAVGQHQMNPRRRDPVKRLDGACELPLHRAHLIDLLQEGVHRQPAAFVEQLPSRIPIDGHAGLCQNHTRPHRVPAGNRDAGAVFRDHRIEAGVCQRRLDRIGGGDRQIRIERRVVRAGHGTNAENHQQHHTNARPTKHHELVFTERLEIVD